MQATCVLKRLGRTARSRVMMTQSRLPSSSLSLQQFRLSSSSAAAAAASINNDNETASTTTTLLVKAAIQKILLETTATTTTTQRPQESEETTTTTTTTTTSTTDDELSLRLQSFEVSENRYYANSEQKVSTRMLSFLLTFFFVVLFLWKCTYLLTSFHFRICVTKPNFAFKIVPKPLLPWRTTIRRRHRHQPNCSPKNVNVPHKRLKRPLQDMPTCAKIWWWSSNNPATTTRTTSNHRWIHNSSLHHPSIIRRDWWPYESRWMPWCGIS